MKYRLHRQQKARTDCHSYHFSLHSKSCRDFKIIWFLSIWFSSSSSCNLNIRYLNDKSIIMTISLLINSWHRGNKWITPHKTDTPQVLFNYSYNEHFKGIVMERLSQKTCRVEHNYQKNSNPKSVSKMPPQNARVCII